MHFSCKALLMGVLVLLAGINNVFAEGVFGDKTRDRHGLSGGEQRQISMEFLKRFGEPNTSKNYIRTNNPWEAKKQRKQAGRTVTWGECRDYALQMRNYCYKRGRDAYNCERLYEGRSRKCDADY